jgi:multiple sugar transport system substrate-binding protein
MRRAAVVLALFLITAGCNASGGAGDGAKPLRVQVSGEPEETKVYGALVKAFERSEGGFDVELIEVADKDQHLAKLTTSFAGGDAPDVFLVNFREYSQFVARGAVEPYETYLGANDVQLDDYYPHPLEAFTYEGKLQCMPQNISSLVVYYSTELFKRAGLKRPRADWSWEDFRQTALALTKGDTHGLGIEPSIIRLAPFVWSNGGEIVDDLEEPATLTFDQPESREAVEFIVSLVREDKVVPSEADVAAQDLETRFVTGKLGMFLSSRKDTPVLREVQGLEWDVAPLPVAKEPAGILHSDGYCISAGGEDARLEEAARFIAFATGEQGQTITALGGRTVPALRSVANSGAFLDPTQPPAHPEVFLEGIDFIRRTPVLATWPEIEDVAEEIFTRAFYEESYSIDEALEALDEQTPALFEEGSNL